MGKRKRRQQSLPESQSSSPIPSKQLKVDGFLESKASNVSNPKKKPSETILHNRFDLLVEAESHGAPETTAPKISEGLSTESQEPLTTDSCSGSPEASLLGAEGFSKLNFVDLVSNQSLLTAKTVSVIFKLLAEINGKVDSLKTLINRFITNQPTALRDGSSLDLHGALSPSANINLNDLTKESRSSLQTASKHIYGSQQKQETHTSPNCILQRNQIALLILNNNMNFRRWNSKSAVVAALSGLLRCESNKLDLLNIDWLTSTNRSKRVLLTFSQPIFPSMLCKMRPFLRTFEIFPLRVFQDTKVTPLMSSSDWKKKLIKPTSVNLHIGSAVNISKSPNLGNGSVHPAILKGVDELSDLLKLTCNAAKPLADIVQPEGGKGPINNSFHEDHLNDNTCNGPDIILKQTDPLHKAPIPPSPLQHSQAEPILQHNSGGKCGRPNPCVFLDTKGALDSISPEN